MRKTLLTLLSLSTAFLLQAQHNYQKAIVVTNNDEKLKGWIDFKEWDRNPSSFTFSSDPGGKAVKTYAVKEVKSFEVEDMDYFERFPVVLSMDKVAPMEQLSTGPDNTAVKDTVFLRVIRKGKMMNLYSYQDKLKMRYYVKEAGSDAVLELLYKKYYSAGTETGERVITDERYRNQLNDVAARHKGVNTAMLLEKLLRTYYTLPGIAGIVDYLNGPGSKAFPPKQKSKVEFYAGLSLFSSTTRYSGNDELANGASNKTSYLPKLSGGIDLYTNAFVKKVMIRLDASLSLSKANISKPMGTADNGYVAHKFDQYTIAFSPQIIYNFYNNHKIKINLGGGLSGNYSVYKNNLYKQKYTLPGIGGHFDYEEAVKLNPFWMSAPVRAGVILKERIDIYAQYNIPVSALVTFVSHSIWTQSWQLGVNILL